MCALLMAMAPVMSLPLASTAFLLMTLSYLFADCAADASLVRLSSNEPVESRGSILSMAYTIRFGFNVLASLLVAFLYNGPPSGCDFSWGMTTQQELPTPAPHSSFRVLEHY